MPGKANRRTCERLPHCIYQHWLQSGPRVPDPDIILFDTMVVDTLKLVIPHPRMHKRRFKLKPICDIDRSIVHPVFHRTMLSLLEDLDAKDQRITEYK